MWRSSIIFYLKSIEVIDLFTSLCAGYWSNNRFPSFPCTCSAFNSNVIKDFTVSSSLGQFGIFLALVHHKYTMLLGIQRAYIKIIFSTTHDILCTWFNCWIVQVLATSTRRNIEYSSNSENDPSNALDGDIKVNVGDDDENMVSSHKRVPIAGYALEPSNIITQRDKHLRYRTRVFAAEYVPLHFQLQLLMHTAESTLLIFYGLGKKINSYYRF